jgi:hypothetical protein
MLDENLNCCGIDNCLPVASDDRRTSELFDSSPGEGKNSVHNVKCSRISNATMRDDDDAQRSHETRDGNMSEDDVSHTCDGVSVDDRTSTMTSSTPYRCQLCPSKLFERFESFEGHCAETHSRLVSKRLCCGGHRAADKLSHITSADCSRRSRE